MTIWILSQAKLCQDLQIKRVCATQPGHVHMHAGYYCIGFHLVQVVLLEWNAMPVPIVQLQRGSKYHMRCYW